MNRVRDEDGGRILDVLAAAIGQRVAEQRRAEARLASFAFDEGRPTAGSLTGSLEAAPPGSAVGPEPSVVDWRYYLARTLREASEPSTLALLELLEGGQRPLRDLGSDPLAVADRVGRLATVGLVARALDSEQVALAPLGEAVLGLLRALESRLSAAADGGTGTAA